MINLLKLKPILTPMPATLSGPRPGDFPVGSLKSRAAARAILKSYDDDRLREEEEMFANLSPFVRAGIECVDDREAKLWGIGLLKQAEEKAKMFGQTLPTPEEMRHDFRIAKLCDEMTEGQYFNIMLSDFAEARRLRELAEEKLKAEARAIKKQKSL